MNLLILDDEELALADTKAIIKDVLPKSKIVTFQLAQQALAYISNHQIDIAFLDIEIPEINGIALAQKFKEIQPELHIIFVTGFEKYAIDAFAIHASGFLMKPILKEDVLREMTFLYGDSFHSIPKKISVFTFGGFDIQVDGKLLEFKRAKSKELLAYLIDRNGRGITAREACAILWEDSVYSKKQQSYYRNVVAAFEETLVKADIQDILIKKRNYIAIRPELLDCDSYRYMNGEANMMNVYPSDYLSCYSWAMYSSWKFEDRYPV